MYFKNKNTLQKEKINKLTNTIIINQIKFNHQCTKLIKIITKRENRLMLISINLNVLYKYHHINR